MILTSLKWTIGTLLILIAISTMLQAVSIDTDCALDKDCQDVHGKYSECVNNTCECSEFFVLHSNECIKVVSHGKTCEDTSQCQGYMGNDAACIQGKCDCFSSLTNETILDPTGKCIQPKRLGEPCTTDNQCIYGNGTTNELAICLVTTKVCGCYMNHKIGLHSENVEGICIVPPSPNSEKECSTVDISLLAIMVAGSAALLLFIYVMFRIATKDRKKETTGTKMNNFNSQHIHHDGVKIEHDGTEPRVI